MNQPQKTGSNLTFIYCTELGFMFAIFLFQRCLPTPKQGLWITRPLAIACLALLVGCSQMEIDQSNDFANNGRDTTAFKRDSLYLKESLVPWLPYPDASFKAGLQQQANYLNRLSEQSYQLEQTQVSVSELKSAVAALTKWLDDPTQAPNLTAYQLAGQDQRGNVQITGYYVPVLSVRHQPDEVYQYPLYRKPPKRDDKGELPSREEIDFEGALKGQGLEIAYSASLIDNFFLHVQGSGMVEFKNGERQLLSWGGVNGHPYRSLGKELIERGEIDRAHISAQSIRQWLKDHPERVREILSTNPSYLFFSEGLSDPVGAANVPLTPLYSAAVDPSVIPLGSILLAQVPTLDQAGNLLGHQWRLLLAQDKGGAIKGPGHIDWYQGIGEAAHRHAGQLKHFGKVWLLLPNKASPPESTETEAIPPESATNAAPASNAEASTMDNQEPANGPNAAIPNTEKTEKTEKTERE